MPVWARFVTAGFVLVAAYSLLFIIPKQVTFSYAGKTCVSQVTLAPSAQLPSTSAPYVVEFKKVWRVGAAQLFSTEVCFIPKTAPKAGSERVAVSPMGSMLFARQFDLNVKAPPIALTRKVLSKEVSATRPLAIPLESPDIIHTYKLRVADKVTDCPFEKTALACNVEALDLRQGEPYAVSLERYYNNDLTEVLGKHTMKTLLPIGFVEGSIANEQLVYDKPGSFLFRFDRPLAEAEAVLYALEGDNKREIPLNITTESDLLTLTLSEELPRKTAFSLELVQVEGKDGSSLNEPVYIAFRTLGGPEVTGVNIGSYGIAQAGTITLTLDQPVANLDALPSLVSIEGATTRVTQSGSSLVLSYSGAGFCQPLTIRVNAGLANQYEITQEAAWSYKTRTVCNTARVIGYSVHGRAILAYTFGSGDKTKLYVGGIHGNEHSSRYLLDAWRNELEAQAPGIPAGTRVVVIPNANPDGMAANTRTNAHNVDLNRNFNTSDWKSDVQTVTGQPFPGGGGPSPESEPETKALAAFSREVAPQFTMSFHSAAAYVIGNGCGSSASIADRYAQLTRYRNMTGNSSAFAYEITGTYDDWLCERLGRTSVLVELVSNTSQEFPRNKNALWETLRQ